jgi:hypothetical protein
MLVMGPKADGAMFGPRVRLSIAGLVRVICSHARVVLDRGGRKILGKDRG